MANKDESLMAAGKIDVKVGSRQKDFKKKKKDRQMTGLAGELFVAAELLKRGFQTSITFGNAKAIDLLVVNPSTNRVFTVQVKSVSGTDPWLIAHEKVIAHHVYVFVSLGKVGHSVEYHVVPGSQLASDPDLFGLLDYPKCPGIGRTRLKSLGFADAWQIFDEPIASSATAEMDTPPC